MRRLATLSLVIAAGALTAAGQQLTITPTTLPLAVSGQTYNPVTLQVSADPGPIVWSFAPGSVVPTGFVVGPAPGGQQVPQGVFCYGVVSPASGAVTCLANPVLQALVGSSYQFTIQAHSTTTGLTGTQPYAFQVVQPLQFTTQSLPVATANTFYSAQLGISGGTVGQDGAQFVWSVIAGTLPAGINLNVSTGLLSGTVANSAVPSTFTIQVTDLASNATITRSFLIDVQGSIQITTTSLPNAVQFQQYSFQLMAANASGLVWSIVQTGSQLPSTFSLSSSGLLTGNGAAGKYTFVVQLTNPLAVAPAQTVTSQTLTLYITLGPLSIKELTLPGATQNVPYQATLTPVGGLPPYAWSFDVAKPQGLSISSTTGAISGTPPSAGSFPIPVTLRDSAGGVFSQSFTLNVGPAVSITPATLPNGSLNVAYFAAPTATGGAIPYKGWTVIAGTLPPGLSLNPANGQISGTPTTQGAFAFTLQVTDFVGSTATQAFTITIGTSQPLTITTTSLPNAPLNQAYSQTLASTGGTQPVISWTVTSGNLPSGLSLNQSTGAITGTAVVSGSATFTVQALDSAMQTASKTLTLTVGSTLTIGAAGFTGSVGVIVSQTVTASGGAPPYTFSVSSGSLPGGLQIGASTGVISGTPNALGTFPVTVRATDNNGQTADASITITINSLPLTIVVPSGTVSGQQPGIAVTISAPATGDLNGTLTLAFLSSVGGTDNTIVFQNGSRLITFTIPNGKTTSPNATVITGTVAGTITLTASVPGNPDVIKTITIAPAVPVISSVVLQQVTGGLNVVVEGYSNTREVSTGSFTFTVSSGNTLSQATVPVTLTSAYATWFNSASSNATGGQFKLTVPFSATQGSATAVTKVSVTLTNAQGVSGAASSP